MLKKKLSPTTKKKWIEALRSAEYKQGLGQLRQDDKFCCLGVLYDVTSKGNWNGSNYTVCGSMNLLNPDDVSGRLYDVLSQHNDNGIPIQWYLAGRNDQYGNFEEIANWIEKNL